MKDILDRLIESLNSGNYLLATVVIVVALVFNCKKIVEFLEERKKARITKLLEAIKCEYVVGLTKTHLEDELATEQFKITTGIHKEKEFREALIQAHYNAKGELSFAHFKRALPHIIYKSKQLEVKITFFDWIRCVYNVISGLFLTILSMLLIVLPSQIKVITITQILVSLIMGALFFTIALFVLSQIIPIVSARKVAKELENNHNNLIRPSSDDQDD